MVSVASLSKLGHDTWQRFQRVNGDLLAAGISFFALLSAAPLAMIVVWVAGLVFGETRARNTLLRTIRRSSGDDLAQTMARLLDAVQETTAHVASILALLVVVWAATRLFVQLQDALNAIWDVRTITEKTGARELAKELALKRLLSFAMVLGCGALLLLMLVLDGAASLLAQALKPALKVAGLSYWFVRLLEVFTSLLLLTTLFAAVYRVLPDARIPWRDAWIGATCTALMIRLGALGLGFVVSHFGVPGTYGALGGIAALLLWTYHMALIFLLGASLTRVLAEGHEAKITPEPHAELQEHA